MKPREIVKTSNDFVRSRCKIKDVIAGRILMAFASLVEEKDVNNKDNFLEYKISASSVINKIDAAIINQDVTFSSFVIQACEYALENMSTESNSDEN